MQQPVAIPTLHLFAVLDRLLIDLLKSLSPNDWQKPTLAKLWTVKDIAAHLLDGNMRAIANMHNYKPPLNASINNYQDLVAFLNELNDTWVNAMKRVSPELLTDLLESTGPQFITYLEQLAPYAPAKYSVAWAGEEQSLNWFHIAREYTEKWHHQQQIREAVGQVEPLMTRELFYPCIATFMCALPFAYRNVEAAEDTIIKFIIDGDAGGVWYLLRSGNVWKPSDNGHADTVVIIPQAIAWKLFTKAITPQIALTKSSITGNQSLASPVFNMVAVMA
jgi:uncharacterized protein (TIGR03083 family)